MTMAFDEVMEHFDTPAPNPEVSVKKPDIHSSPSVSNLYHHSILGFEHQVYCEPFPEENKDILYAMFDIAKALDKNILLIDWTHADLKNVISPFMANGRIAENFYVIIMPNIAGSCPEQWDVIYQFPMTEHSTRKFTARCISNQYNHFKDPLKVCVGMDYYSYSFNDALVLKASRTCARLEFDPRTVTKLHRKLLFKWLCGFFTTHKEEFSRDVFERNALRYSPEYNDVIRRAKNKVVKELNVKISNLKADYDSHMNGMLRIESDLLDMDSRKRLLDDPNRPMFKELDKDSLKTIFFNMLKAKKYESFDFVGSSDVIRGYTGEIHLMSCGKKYFVGKFRVEIWMTGKVKLINEHGKGNEGADHPHVNDGTPCLGTLKEFVPQLIHRGDFLNLFSLMYDFLTSYNPPGAYGGMGSLERGWGKSEDWCPKCKQPTLQCKCKPCVKCAHVGSDCYCSKCPRLGTLLEQAPCYNCRFFVDPKRENPNEPGAIRQCVFGTGLKPAKSDFGEMNPLPLTPESFLPLHKEPQYVFQQ